MTNRHYKRLQSGDRIDAEYLQAKRTVYRYSQPLSSEEL